MSISYLIILLILLAIPVVFLFAPSLSAGMMTPTHKREVKQFIFGAEKINSQANEIDQLNKKRSIIGKLSKNRIKRTTSRLTISKKLRYAQWPISQVTFHLSEILISIACILFTRPYLSDFLIFCLFFSGPVIMRMLLSSGVNKRFKKFDSDFPQFLLSIVGLLKTGMTPTNALESAAKGLDPKSLVRAEVNLMLERMRLGVPEEKSIGSFAETINHPEIELFIQALLISKRVGGTLSDTLERLAKQVRKRQFFRDSANAAVAMQRASSWLILIILILLEIYIYFTYPQLVVDAWNDPIGWTVWQSAFFLVIVSTIWSREVTKIKV